ncbi:MAG: 4'-phosphopantetheinyl transferase superfamily protein [Candidatus Promineifilaceae bacterium]|nr:4'-phosphopantetheinyl transferase superfamily protein [Candidatus Promineifilaceae bacterium]
MKRIDVWRASLDVEADTRSMFHQTLSPDEQQRAARFYFERHRQRFVAGRGLLRHLLAHYLELDPKKLVFAYNDFGRPSLHLPSREPPLHFNVAHSGALVLYAFSAARAVGVDVERVDPGVDYVEIAQRFFAPRERQALAELSGGIQAVAFFKGWTRKEAFIKAQGMGLSLPLDSFEVSLAPGEPARLIHTEDDDQEAQQWSLWDLAPAPGYAGALAVRASGLAVTTWECDLTRL